MDQIKYRLYPTLLNCFDRFEKGYLDNQSLIDRINRVPVPTTEAQKRGVSFEEAVIKGVDEEAFDPDILQKVRSFLPRPMVRSQVYCEYAVDNVLLYGYVDLIGRTLAVDIKTTSRYAPDMFASSHQNFYLPALQSKGIRALRYVITDFTDVYTEEYSNPLDFSFQLRQINTFCSYIEDNRDKITDQRIFGLNQSF